MLDGLTGCVFRKWHYGIQLPAQRDQVSHQLNSFLLLFFMSNMDSMRLMPMEHQLQLSMTRSVINFLLLFFMTWGGRKHVHQILWIRLVISFNGCLLYFRKPYAVQWCIYCTVSPIEQLCAALLHEQNGLNGTNAEGGPAASMLRLLMSVLLCFMTHGVQEKVLWSINCQLSVARLIISRVLLCFLRNEVSSPWQSHEVGDCLTQVWLLLEMLAVIVPLLPTTTTKGMLSVLRLVDSAIELAWTTTNAVMVDDRRHFNGRVLKPLHRQHAFVCSGGYQGYNSP